MRGDVKLAGIFAVARVCHGAQCLPIAVSANFLAQKQNGMDASPD
jgi:hypothetical protein